MNKPQYKIKTSLCQFQDEKLRDVVRKKINSDSYFDHFLLKNDIENIIFYEWRTGELKFIRTSRFWCKIIIIINNNKYVYESEMVLIK